MHTAEREDYELVEGELIPLSSGTPRHAFVRDLAGDCIRSYLRRNQFGRALAEVDCRIKDETLRRPDLSVFLGPLNMLSDCGSVWNRVDVCSSGAGGGWGRHGRAAALVCAIDTGWFGWRVQ